MEKGDDGRGKKWWTEVKRKEGMGKRWDRKRGVVRWQTKVESPKAAFIEQRETHRCIKSILHRREPSVRHDTSVKHDRGTRFSVFCNMHHATVAAASHLISKISTADKWIASWIYRLEISWTRINRESIGGDEIRESFGTET